MNKCDKCVHNGICTRQRLWSNGFESDKDKIENCDAFLIDLTCKPRTNYDKITSSVESLAEYIYQVTDSCPFANCDVPCQRLCEDCIKEWLQKECDNGK